MNGSVTLTILDEAVRKALDDLASVAGGDAPMMADIAGVLVSESERQFRSQSGPGGNWPELADTTRRIRTKRGTWPGQILQVSAGGLAASVQSGHSATEAWVSSNKPYAAMHQFGGTTSPRSAFPNREIPARPFLPFDPEAATLTPEAEAGIDEVLAERLGRPLGQ